MIGTALAALASTAAFAQSTANITGTFGAGYQSAYTANGATQNKGFTMTDSSVRVAVSEDLGGGLRAAAFVQVAGNASRGGGVTKEDSTVSLSGGFGTVAINNTRTSDTAVNALVFGSSLPVTSFYATVSSRVASDIFSYTSPAVMPGLTLGFARAEVDLSAAGVAAAGDTDKTSTNAVNVFSANYVQGPLAVMGAYKSTNLSAALVAAGAKKNNLELAATYDFGVAKVGYGFDSKTSSTGDALHAFGVSVPMGAINVGLNYAKRGDNKFYEAGLKYSLSKRTTANVMFGKLTGTSARVAGTGAVDTTKSNAGNQYRIGVVHTF